MIHIEKEDFLRLCQFENELNQLFENIIYQYCKEWCELNPGKMFEYFEKKNVVADYVNKKIIENNIIVNGQIPNVWFNSQGTGQMLYWSTKDSKGVGRIDELLQKKALI